MTDVDLERTAAMPNRAPRRWLTKHRALVIGAIALPLVLIFIGFVLVVANLVDSTTPARPALPQRSHAGATSGETAAPGPIPTAIPNVDPQQQALAVAQELATNFARHDYAAARAMSQSPLDDATLAKQYLPVTKLTVVPVDVTPVGPSQYEMRLGLVSQQSSQNIPSTVFYCVDWRVDAATNTVIQGKAGVLKTIPAQVDADQFPEFATTCHGATLS